MTTVARLEAILSARTDDFDRAMARSETKMQKTGRVAGIAGAAIAGGLAYGLEKSVKAAMEAQVSQARLEQAFRTAGLNAGKYADQIDKAETHSRALGFAGNQTREALGSLVVATHNASKSVSMLATAEDLARFKHVGLAEATKMLTSASAGNARAIKQLGILLVPLTDHVDALRNAHISATTAAGRLEYAHAKLQDKMETASHAVDLVTEKVKGQGAVYAQTAAGSLQVFHERLQFLEVTLGTALLPAIVAVTDKLSAMTAFFSRHVVVTKILIGALGVLAAALLAARAAQLLMNLAVLANPYVAATVAVVAAGVAIYVYRDKLRDVYNWIKDHWPLLAGILAGPIGYAVAEIIKHRDRLIAIFTNLPGQIASAFTAGIGVVKDAIVGLFGKVIDWVKSALGIASPSSVFHKIGQHSIQGFINGVGSMGGVLKHAVERMALNAVKGLGGVPGAIFGGGGNPQGGHGSGIHASPQQAMGFAHAQSKGFGWLSQWGDLVRLWNQESGWRWNAKNPSSGAYGIPQALPASKMASAGPDWSDNAFTQIAWGMQYIASRYGNPSRAWAHEKAVGWYDRGGWLPTGLSLALNNTGRPERVVPHGGGGDTVIVQVGPEEVARVVFDQLRGKAQVFQRYNGRPAFGGA